jgi:MFS family permease
MSVPSPVTAWPLPAGVPRWVRRILIGRALRALADGYVAVLLPAYLLALGFELFDVGLLSTATLAGSAAATLGIGATAHRMGRRRLLLGAALLMAATGTAFAALTSFWPLVIVAFVGTLNPSSGDVSIFLPIEQAELADAATGGDARTALFTRYALAGSLFGALGALCAAVPAWLVTHSALGLQDALRAMFGAYGAIGIVVWLLYRGIEDVQPHARAPSAPLAASRGIVLRLAALFCVDSFAGGLLVNAMLAAWLYQRFGLSMGDAGRFFFWAGLLTTGSQLLAPRCARRFGLLNTMVFTHIPASLFLIAAAFAPSLQLALALLLARSALSQMDVPARNAFVMAVVTPEERVAAASFTAVPKSLAAAAAPALGGALLAGGWLAAPLLACGMLKIAYDLSLLIAFQRHKRH